MKSLFILGMVLISANSFAGNEKGNGAGLHFCKAEKTQEIYDIYEAQARFGFTIKADNSAVDVQLKKVLAKIKKANPYIAKEFEKRINYLKDGHMILRAKVSLSPIGDANILLVDEDCAYKQLANWDEVSGNLIVKKDYYDQMDNLNKTALYTHEALYKVGRDLNLLPEEKDGSTTSDTIRRMVGEIFSTRETLEQMWDMVDPQIERDRVAAEYAIEIKKINDFKQACAIAAKEYFEFLETIKNDKCGTIKSYLELYYDRIGVCTTSSVNLEYALKYSDLSLSTRLGLLDETYSVYKSVSDELRLISSFHENHMNEVMKCKGK